jgi:hypothetical protein
MAAGMAAVGVISSRGAGGGSHHGKPLPPSVAGDAQEAETRRLMADGSAESSHTSECEHCN